MRWHVLLFACASAFASSAVADTKLSGSVDCDPRKPAWILPVPDDPAGHVFVLEQRKCRWTKPWTIAGSETTENMHITFIEVSNAGVRTTSVAVTTHANGDKTFVHSGGKPGSGGSTDEWTYTDGTGKLQGIEGQGTSTCRMKGDDPDGGLTCNITGSYGLSAPKKKP